MAVLTVSQLDVTTGAAPAFVAAAGGGDKVVTDFSGRTFLVVKNGGGASITVTVVDPRISEAGVALTDPTYSVAAAGERWIPLEGFFNNSSTGQIDITYSGVTSVTVAAVRR